LRIVASMMLSPSLGITSSAIAILSCCFNWDSVSFFQRITVLQMYRLPAKYEHLLAIFINKDT
jgi:hypothetical protein